MSTWLCCSFSLAPNIFRLSVKWTNNYMAAILSPHHTGTSDYCTLALNLQMFMQNVWETHYTQISGCSLCDRWPYSSLEDWNTLFGGCQGRKTTWHTTEMPTALITTYGSRERCNDVVKKSILGDLTLSDDCITAPSLDSGERGVLEMIIAPRTIFVRASSNFVFQANSSVCM